MCRAFSLVEDALLHWANSRYAGSHHAHKYESYLMPRFLYLLSLIIIGGMTACTSLVPATTPPQLAYTAGAPVVVTDDMYDAGVFRVRYPQGWTVVKNSVAGAPMSAVLVSPDETQTIQIAVEPLAPLRPDAAMSFSAEREIRGNIIYVLGEAPAEQADVFEAVFEQVVASLD